MPIEETDQIIATPSLLRAMRFRDVVLFLVITGFSVRKKQLDRESGVISWTIHDLRRTARSLMSRAGVPTDHAEMCLGHVLTGVRGVYDRHAYFAEKAAAFEKLAAEIANVVREA